MYSHLMIMLINNFLFSIDWKNSHKRKRWSGGIIQGKTKEESTSKRITLCVHNSLNNNKISQLSNDTYTLSFSLTSYFYTFIFLSFCIFYHITDHTTHLSLFSSSLGKVKVGILCQHNIILLQF